MSMQHPRLIVYAGAMTALVFMTVSPLSTRHYSGSLTVLPRCDYRPEDPFYTHRHSGVLFPGGRYRLQNYGCNYTSLFSRRIMCNVQTADLIKERMFIVQLEHAPWSCR